MSRPGSRWRHSIVWKLFISVAGCMLFVLATVLLLNTFALKSYYVRQKQTQVSRAFTAVNAACGDTDRLREHLMDLQERGTVTAVLWDDSQVLFTTLNTDRFLIRGDVSIPAGTYVLEVIRGDELMAGDRAQDLAIRLVGTLQNGWHIYLRTPVAAIEDSIAVTNRFLLMSGGVALAVGLLLVLLVSRRYAAPVRALSQQADRVARLDFGGRYTGRQRDELGMLGNSINTMSAALESVITQLKNANLRLTADIRRRTEQDNARRAFISNVSHELKTPMALIAAYAEGLREDIAGGGENKDYYCAVIEDEAHRVTQMLRRLTMLMQLEDGGDPEIERFDMTELMRNMMERERIRFEKKRVEITLPPPEPVWVYADPGLMENVMQNYLSNALNHVPEGGRVEGRISALSPERVRVSVYNSGSHIPEEELPRVWESFYKVDKARTRAYGGSGIGLSVVAAIMKVHGMPYGAINHPEGVEFYIELESR